MKLSLKKVGHKMGAAFLLLILLYCFNSLYNQSSLNSMTSSSSNLYENHYRTLRFSLRTSRDIQQLKGAMLELAVYESGVKDTASFREVNDNIGQIKKKIRKLKEGFEQQKVHDVDKHLEVISQVCDRLDRYSERIEGYLSTKDRDSIRELYNNDFEQDFELLADHINVIVGIVSNLARLDHTTIKQKSSVISYTSWTFFGIIVLSLMSFGWLLTKSIGDQLGCEPYEAAAITKQLAKGDFSMKFTKKEPRGLYHDIKITVDALSNVIKNVVTIATDLSNTSNQLANGSKRISEGANDQAASAEEVSVSMDEMDSSIDTNSNNAVDTEKISRHASDQIQESNKVVTDAVKSMKAINERIGVIEEIVSQTNILALNAAVEASRAGAHGKGFAVIAGEIRKLAEHSKEAADEIIEISDKTVILADQSSEMLAQLVPEITKTADLLKQIVNSSNEQKTSSSEMNKALQQLNHVIQQNAASSEEMASGSEELNGMAENLKKQVSFFKVVHV